MSDACAKGCLASSGRSGFLVFEAVLALALFSLTIFSTVSLSWGAERTLEIAKARQSLIDSAKPILLDPQDHQAYFKEALYGNDGSLVSFSSSTSDGAFSASLDLAYLSADGSEGYGKDSCPHDLAFPPENGQVRERPATSTALPIPASDAITGLVVLDGIAYVSADSNVDSDPDFLIFDLTDPIHPSLLSSLNTGPGLAGIAVAGPYAYAAERSSVNQLQVIGIRDRNAPALVASEKVPLDNASSTRPFGSAVFYDKGSVYLGTEKGDSPELTVWTAADPARPALVDRYEVGSEVEDIEAAGDVAYVASTDANQLMEFDIGDPSVLSLVRSYAPSGWQTATGKAISAFENKVSFGRDTGGFDVSTNPEFLLYEKGGGAPDSSFNEPGGVYGIVARPPSYILLTHRSQGALRLDDEAGSTSGAYDIPGIPAALACDSGNVYVASNDPPSIAFIPDFHEK